MEMGRSRCQLVAYLPPNQRSRALHRSIVDPGVCLGLCMCVRFFAVRWNVDGGSRERSHCPKRTNVGQVGIGLI